MMFAKMHICAQIWKFWKMRKMRKSANRHVFEKNRKMDFWTPPRIIWSSLACTDDRPVTCGMNACKICCDLYTLPYWTSNDGLKLKVGRITCKSKNLIYILIDKSTNEVLYVGQTCQNLNTRLGQNRKRNTWHRISDYFIVAIQSNLESVKRIEHEQFLIQILKPSHNKHVQFYWWQAKSSYSHLTDNDTSNWHTSGDKRNCSRLFKEDLLLQKFFFPCVFSSRGLTYCLRGNKFLGGVNLTASAPTL